MKTTAEQLYSKYQYDPELMEVNAHIKFMARRRIDDKTMRYTFADKSSIDFIQTVFVNTGKSSDQLNNHK